ncbi:YceD family protein [Halothiobacillus sp. DCM-1]|uniref:YceD family protein n=1 Tax=Halothiobacillus sp. DCM-1 TaxID=3112558 RepID=UPI00324E40D7
MAQLPRLLSWTPDDQSDASLAYELRFFRDASRALLASVQVEGVAKMPCARCLAPMTVPVEGRSVVQFVHSEAQAAQVPDAYEPVLLDDEGQVSLPDLIEEEFIMALPSVVMHDAACAPAWREESLPTPLPDAAAAQTVNPFAALAGRLGTGKTEPEPDQ